MKLNKDTVIPEEVREYMKKLVQITSPSGMVASDKWIHDTIQKQENEIGVGDFYYAFHNDSRRIIFDLCEDQAESDRINRDCTLKKAPKKMTAQLEALRIQK